MPFNLINNIKNKSNKSNSTNYVFDASFALVGITLPQYSLYVDVAISDDGKYILATVAENSINICYLSSNYGTTFTDITNRANNNYGSCEISSDGKYMMYYTRGPNNSNRFFYSTNYGALGSFITAGSAYEKSAMSSSGKYLVFTKGNSNIIDYYDMTTGSMSTVTSNTLFGFSSSAYFSDIIISNTGKYCIAWTDNQFGICNNYLANNWKYWSNANMNASSSYIRDIAFTDDTGTNIPMVFFAVNNDGLYYISNIDTAFSSGSNSPTINSNIVPTKITSATFGTDKSWNNIVVSNDGKYIIAGSSTKIYCSRDGGSIWNVCTIPIPSLRNIVMTPNGHYVIGIRADGNQNRLYMSKPIV